MAPLMAAFGLPGEAALVLVLGMSINIYAAIAACAGLALTAGQATTIALVLGFAHNLYVESAVLLRLTPRGGAWIALRVVAALVAGTSSARGSPHSCRARSLPRRAGPQARRRRS